MLQKWKLKGSQTKDVSPFQGHFHGRKFTLQEKAEMTSHSRGVAGREGGYSEFCWGGGGVRTAKMYISCSLISHLILKDVPLTTTKMVQTFAQAYNTQL